MIRELQTDDLGSLGSLLGQAGLPATDIDAVDWYALVGVSGREGLVAAGGLERCGDSLLLRSVVTHPSERGRGLGGDVVRQLHRAALESGRPDTWLLTETAAEYFALHHGYRVVDRDGAPAGIRESGQFSGLCPASAVLMRRKVA